MLSRKKLLITALAMAALACGDSSGPDEANPSPGSLEGDGDATGSGVDAGGGDHVDAGVGGGDSGAPNVPGLDGGSPFVPDPASLDDGGALQGSGSCCAEHSTPGCSNADLMVCVCEKDPTCCSVAWGKQCAFIVEQKYCQPNVRECVLGSGEGQWGQTQCETEWSNFCDSVAEIQCGAVPGCF
jgi:hypothetical protein